MCGFSFVSEVLGREIEESFRRRGIRGSSFFEVDFDNSAMGSFQECSFIPSRVDNGDFGRGRPYNLIRFSIIHRDIPLPWRGVRVPAHGRGGYFLHTDGVVHSAPDHSSGSLTP